MQTASSHNPFLAESELLGAILFPTSGQTCTEYVYKGSAVDADDIRIMHQDNEKRAFVVEYRRAVRLIGVVGCNAAAKTMRYSAGLTRSVADLGADV
jgi:hypothetical protein